MSGSTRPRPVVAMLGNPNTGKTTLFNGLTGLFLRVGNYPGVTVERKSGFVKVNGTTTVELLDLPGTYSLAAHSPDEAIVADVLMGLQPDESPVDAMVLVLDAANIRRNLYLLSQLLELEIPAVVALNMVDVARQHGIRVDAQALSDQIGVPVVETCGSDKAGLQALLAAIGETVEAGGKLRPEVGKDTLKSLSGPVDELVAAVGREGRRLSRVEALRVLVDEGGHTEQRLVAEMGAQALGLLSGLRQSVGTGLPALEARERYAWVDGVVSRCVTGGANLRPTRSDRLDLLLTHRLWGSLIFLGLMGFVFQAIYSWSGPLIDGIDEVFGGLGFAARTALPDGPLASLVVDGVIRGVGSVIIFLPQIALLFLFVSLLEGCGYMSRAAFLMDRLLTVCGLSGKSFIPMLSSFACAVPGIMATRTIEDRRDRFVTILVAPLMSCSARLPVYTIFISAFVPDRVYMGGWIGLQGATLLGLYCLGVVVAVPVAWLLKHTLFKGSTAPFILELPGYRLPSARSIVARVLQSCRSFLRDAGTIILTATVVMWALAYFPRPQETLEAFARDRARLQETLSGSELSQALRSHEARRSSELLNQSLLGRAGHFIEPAVRPLGWDWRIGMATLASFPAREIVISTLGTIYSLGTDPSESPEDLRRALRNATWGDGQRLFTLPVALSLMVFFALCSQCTATLAVIHRETRSWRWPVFAFCYLTLLAYAGAFLAYRVATLLGWGV
jgi:ferrous iron transport protein B